MQRRQPKTRTAAVARASAPVLLAIPVAEENGRWRVRSLLGELLLPADESVDPELVREALASRARVLVDATGAPVIVGVVQTARALRIERDGEVRARVEAFTVRAAREVLLQTGAAFLRAKGAEVEIYGNRVLTRAREMAKVLARMINLNSPG